MSNKRFFIAYTKHLYCSPYDKKCDETDEYYSNCSKILNTSFSVLK